MHHLRLVERSDGYFIGENIRHIIGIALWPTSVGMLIASPVFDPNLGWRARPSPLNCKNESLVFVMERETAAQALVGSKV